MKRPILALMALASLVMAFALFLGGQATPQAQAAPGDGLAAITAPAAGCSIGIGVAFDGTNILYTCAGQAAVFKTNLASADLGSVATVDAGGNAVSVDAIAWDPNENRLWGGDTDGAAPNECRIWSIDMSSGLATLRFSFSSDAHDPLLPGCDLSFFDGLTVDTVTNTLYLSTDVHTFIHHVNKNGTPAANDNIPFETLTTGLCPWAAGFGYVGCLNSGLAIGLDGTLFAGTASDGKIMQLDPTTPAFIGQFATVTGRDEDLECGPLFTKPDGTVVETILSRDLSNRIDVLEAPAQTCVSPVAQCAEHPIAPSSVEATLFPGESLEVEKCVEVPLIPPKPDIYFLADTTGSMGPVISAVQSDIASVMSTISTLDPTAEFGAGNYKDFPYDAYAFSNDAPAAPDDGLGGNPDASDAIAAWTAGGGVDGPEGQLFALDQIADAGDPTGITFRPAAEKIVVWFGDAPGHDPVCSAISGLGYDITEASATAKLVAGGVKVIAISVVTASGAFFPAALDDDPTAFGGNYAAACGTEGGATGQATRIAAATGGVHLTGVNPSDIASAILFAIGSVSVTVEMHSTCSDPITTTFDPASQTVSSGGVASFVETISVAATAPGGTYECDDFATIDGERLLNEDGQVALEHKTIKVPEGFMTGVGQIVNGKGSTAKKISFGGNVGFLADFSLVGQWETNFHNVAGTALDGKKFHSTSFTELQFYKDSGPGPNPPPANANVGRFTAIGRLDNVDGYTLKFCLADRGEGGRLRDSARLQLFNPGGTLIYDSYASGDYGSQDNTLTGVCTNRYKLSGGNFQVHSSLKQ